MQVAHEMIRDFIKANDIDMAGFNEWFADAGFSEADANVHDSRYLAHLEAHVAEREASLQVASRP